MNSKNKKNNVDEKEKPVVDCRFFSGMKPCGRNISCTDCCPERKRFDHRTLIIKLGALGDVLRTTPLLTRLKDQWPDGHITWLTRQEAEPLLDGLPEVDRLVLLDEYSLQKLMVQSFDLLICLDKDDEAISLASLVKAKKKLGFSMNSYGNLDIFNKEAVTLLKLGVDDEFKYRINQKSLVQLNFEALDWEYKGEEYRMELPELAREKGVQLRRKISRSKIEGPDILIGINYGCGPRFATKKWPLKNALKLAELISDRGWNAVILGGPDEYEEMEKIRDELSDLKRGIQLTGNNLKCASEHTTGGHRYFLSEISFPERIYVAEGDMPLMNFAGLLSACDAVVSTDSLAMHLSLGLKVPVVALFGPTCSTEIDLFNRGVKIGPLLECAPCYKPGCIWKSKCMGAITPEDVMTVMEGLI